MSIAPIGSFQMTPFTSNPIQSLAKLALTTLVVNTLANIPMAAALAAPSQEVCEVLCSPLPGNKDDVAEKACQKTCTTEDGTVTKSAKWLIDTAGKTIKFAEPIMPLVDLGVGALDCSTVCSLQSGFVNGGGKVVWAGVEALRGNRAEAISMAAEGALKSACTTSLFIPYYGNGACYSCCVGMKSVGII